MTTRGVGGADQGQAPGGDDLAALEHAISTLEAQRAVLGDAVVDTALVPLQERRSALVNQAAEEQRKLVTVVFADLVGFTDMSSWLDAEDTRNIVDAYFTRWLRVIEEHGGVVEKFIGDAVMAVFGLRQSWEDDAQRAVRSALAMVADLDELNDQLAPRYGVRLQMRVGVDTGDVVVSTLGDRGGAEFVVVGQTVNRASRLQSIAPPGGIMISSDTHRQIRGRFSMERREGLVLKGIDEPVVGFLVVNERPHVFQLDRSGGVEGVETTTVGREIELRFLQERLWDVVEEGHWQVVTIVGDAGVGKSRLLLEFDSWLAESPQRVYWFRGRASHTDQNRANALLRDVLGSRFAIAESDPAATVRLKLEDGFVSAWEVVDDDPDSARAAARLVGTWLNFDLGDLTDVADPPGMLDPLSLRNRAAEALAGYFARLSTRQPVVVLLEDLHWADDGSLSWLDAADELLRDSRVLVVGTTRPTIFEDRPRWTEGLDQHVRLPLDTLSRRESRLLLQQLLQHVVDPPAELLDLIIGSAEGNPFYIEELVTWLIDAGVVVKGETSWTVEHDLVGSVLVPSTLRGVLQARLDALSNEERGLLQRASVVGRVFWDDAVDRLAASSRPGDADVSATLDGLRRRELVFEREVSSFDSAREFLFKHALLRDVAYDGVLRSHRQRYHARAAAWLSEVSGRSGREDEYAALIAEHYDRAGDPAAGAWYFRAGRQAMSVYALAEADQLLGRALELVTDDPVLRYDVLASREAMHDRVGDKDAQELDLTEMEELLNRFDDPGRLVGYRIARSRLLFGISRYDEAEEWAEQAADAATEAGLPAAAAEAALWQGKSLVWHDEADAARAVLTRALDELRIADRPVLVAEAQRYLSILANNEGQYAEALDLVVRAREGFVAAGDLEGEGTALGQMASTLFNMNRIAEARATLEQVLPVFHRSGHAYREAIVVGNLATIAQSQGELAVARRWAEQATVQTRSLLDREATVNNLLVLGMIAAAVGDWQGGEASFAEALELARDVESRTHETDALVRWAFLALEREDLPRALELAREADEVSEHAMSGMERGHAKLVRGYAELANGHDTVADRAFAAAGEAYHGIELEVGEREARVGRAAVLLAQGRVADAVRLVEEVYDHLDRDSLAGSLRSTTILDTCRRVLAAADDPRADELLARSQTLLREASELVGDPAMAAGFLRVPANARLLRVRPAAP
jgi:class 3 adenylate cyclase/tetratricopeptide (TPR) repeat protein